MIVRCIANTGADLPAVNIDPRSGYNRTTEFPLTIGREYSVFGMTAFLGSVWYYIIDDDDHEWPIWKPSALFDVVNGSLPSDWTVGYRRYDVDNQFPVISFPEWAHDPTFYERLLDGDPEAARVFAARRREIEAGS
jgi:hypothetical protein